MATSSGSGGGGDDPLQGNGDPWNADTNPERQTADSFPQEGGVRPGSQPSDDRSQFPQRVIHDVPPVWNGKDPDTQVEPYLKTLKGWLATTRTIKNQQGLIIMQFAEGDLKTLINEKTIEELTGPESGQEVYDHIYESFSEYIQKPMPKALERALFSPETRRYKGEGMVTYIPRKETLYKELECADCKLPDDGKGYLPGKVRDLT